MIKQSNIGLASRTLANPFDQDGFLPLITAPMYSVVDESNYQVFLDNKIQVCLPRGERVQRTDEFFSSVSLNDFKTYYINEPYGHNPFNKVTKVCIDTANGNNPELHKAIRDAKKVHGDNLVIMAGNVASVEAFVELAETGVDYIRVGIGGGNSCNTTSNTGVGQENLETLVKDCKRRINSSISNLKYFKEESYGFYKRHGVTSDLFEKVHTKDINLAKVKIVADGISSYVDFCQKEYGFNDNGYAAINKLLFAGADLVMVGKLFAQCVESAGEKKVIQDGVETLNPVDFHKGLAFNSREVYVKYSGMSTQEEQRKYKRELDHAASLEVHEPVYSIGPLKPSEGSVNWIPVRWTLDQWLSGSQNQDSYPYLMGWVNSVKSAMAYAGKTHLQ